MRKLLEKKYQEELPVYTESELIWLLDHIGYPDKSIRDDLVFNSLARAFQEGLLVLSQARFLVEKSLAMNGLNDHLEEQGQVTLTRSFTALLYANILFVDRSEHSPYYQFLKDYERKFLLDQALIYLSQEQDTTDYTEDFGWVHAFAHGADLLVEAVCHPAFSRDRFADVLDVLTAIFKRVPHRFIADEEWRLARVIYQPILEERLPQELVVDWLSDQRFVCESRVDFQRFSNFRSMLLEVYVALSSENQLSEELKHEIIRVAF